MRVWFSLAACLVMLAVAGRASAQVRDGSVSGSVVTGSTPLAGVVVVLSGPAGDIQQITGERGEFHIDGVSPGTYHVSARRDGYWPTETAEFSVSVGQTTAVDLTMTPAVEEVRVVPGPPPLLDLRRVSTGTNLDQAELERLPTARDTWEAVRQTPGVLVDRVNIAGNESTEPAAIAGPGYLMSQQAWAIDGVNVTDGMTQGTAAAFFDFDTFQEVQVTTGGSDVGVANGGSINLVTRRGTNEWLGSGRLLVSSDALESAAHVDTESLATAGPWNLGTPQQAIASANRIALSRDGGADAGGPLVDSRLWVWAAASRQDIDLRTIGDYREVTHFTNAAMKVDARPATDTSIELLVLHDRRDKAGRDVGPLRPPETSWNFPVVSSIAKLGIDQVIRGRHFASGSVAYVGETLDANPVGGTAVNAVVDPNGVWHGSFVTGRSLRPQIDAAGDVRSYLHIGSVGSELRLGGAYRFAWQQSDAAWPGPGGVIGLATAIHSIGVPLGVATVANHSRDDRTLGSLYVQDTLSLRRVTVSLGARYDDQHGHNRPSSLPRNDLFPTLLPGLVFPGGDPGFDWRTLTPRVGVTAAIDEARRTLLKASYRRYPDELGFVDIQQTNPTQYQPSGLLGVAQSATFLWFDNGDLAFDPREIGPVVATSGVDPTRAGLFPNAVDPRFSPPMTDELIAGIERELPGRVVVGADITWRNTHGVRQLERLVYDDGVPRTGVGRVNVASDYVHAFVLTGTLPDGEAYDVPVDRLRPGVTWLGGEYLTNGARTQSYAGVTMSVRRRLSDGWMLRGWIDVNSWRWHVPPGSAIDPTPTMLRDFADGNVVVQDTASLGGIKTSVFMNSPWSYSLAGLYQLAPQRRWGVDVSFDLYGRSGYPIPYFVSVPAAQTGDGIDRQVGVSPRIADFRNEAVNNLNARVEKTLRAGSASSISLSVDAFNVLNRASVLQRQHELNLPTGNDVLEVVSPRVLRLGVRVRFGR